MRVIAGQYKGRSLYFDKTPLLRPTGDKVKESIFNILQGQVAETRVLDLCCGTGSLGLEALSRGASFVSFVDRYTPVLKKNIELLAIPSEKYQIYKTDLKRFFSTNPMLAPFDLIFLDPPYHADDLYSVALNAIYEFGILKSSGMIICEHDAKFDILSQISGFISIGRKARDYRYGQSKVTVIQ